jgi:hypothetical protein
MAKRERQKVYFSSRSSRTDRKQAGWLGKRKWPGYLWRKVQVCEKVKSKFLAEQIKKKSKREQLIAGSSMKFRHALGPDIKRIHTMSCLAVDGSFLLLLLFLRELPYVNGAQMAAAPTPHERRKLQRKIAAAKAD